MKALITGACGQLGRSLIECVPVGIEAIGLGSRELDITNGPEVAEAIKRIQPSVILNAAAYTAVDKAEDEHSHARAVNCDAVAHLARAATAVNSRLVHISTDFVFSGEISRPLRPNDMTAPTGVYGRTKLAGEAAALAHKDTIVLRTSWLYSRHGSNFVRTMLRLMRERDEIGVVCDQIGTPTWAGDLADAVWQLAIGDGKGLMHYSNSGAASWYDFAVAIRDEAETLNLLGGTTQIRPIFTTDYPTPAKRPSYSILDCRETYELLGKSARHWRAALRMMLQGMAPNG